MQNQKDYVTFLWQTKLKSRLSFLTILEFVGVNKAQFKDILQLLAPIG
jgi:hypothetical protein